MYFYQKLLAVRQQTHLKARSKSTAVPQEKCTARKSGRHTHQKESPPASGRPPTGTGSPTRLGRQDLCERVAGVAGVGRGDGVEAWSFAIRGAGCKGSKKARGRRQRQEGERETSANNPSRCGGIAHCVKELTGSVICCRMREQIEPRVPNKEKEKPNANDITHQAMHQH